MRRWVSAGTLAVLVVGAFAAGPPYVSRDNTAQLTAHFTAASGVHPGSDVRILGVKVGTVRRVVPDGTTVRLELDYERRYRVPADAVAVIVAPSLASDRYVQLAPVYRGGDALPDGADLPVTRTATPVEVDDVFRSLHDLTVALGPRGANSGGALSRLLAVGRRNLDGNGHLLNGTIRDLSTSVRSLTEHRSELSGTVRDLQRFAAALAASDGQVRAFNANLAAVGRQLDAARRDMAEAIRTLSTALAELAAFVRENRRALASNVDALGEISAILVRQKEALTTVADLAPAALSNLALAYDATTGSLAIRDNALVGTDPARLACATATGGGALARAPAGACTGQDRPGTAQSLDLTLGGILGGAR